MPSCQGWVKFENFICFEVGHGTRNCFCMIVGVGKRVSRTDTWSYSKLQETEATVVDYMEITCGVIFN